MDFFEVVIRNKRFHEFKSDQKLSSDQIKQLMACAQLAPSLSDVQNFTYIIISDPAIKNQVAENTEGSDWIKNAAAIFAVVVISREDSDDVNIVDAIIASSQLMLAATANNLGSNFIVDFNQEVVSDLLGVSHESLEVIALIPIGETLDKGSQGYKKTLAELCNHNTLGNPYKFE
ncbi:MAG: nitroreductase family protein [Candidatus Heimdallarchaeota archaeon]|nr:MAG: nitroreductase family protein [Candidatus Heimdallarchaeota archaeon]